MKHKYIALMLVASVLCGCRTGKGNDGESSAGFILEGNQVKIEEGSPLESKLELARLEKEDVDQGFTVTASVSPRPDGYAEVGAPFNGRVTRSAVRLGDRVYRGQVLFEMSSPDFMEAVKDYLESNNAYSVASANLNRKSSLRESGVVSEKEWEDARREASDAETALALSRQVLSVFGVNPANVQMGQPLRVISPISGTVVKNSLVLGQILSDDSEPPVSVADLSKVWVTANVRENSVRRLAKGQEASVILPSGNPLSGSIFYVGDMLDDKTRTVPVVIECSNPEKALKPGMFVSARFTVKDKDAIVIPATAVFQSQEHPFVYVLKEGLTFEKRPVRLESLDAGQMLVLEGLEEGETIIADGGIYLSR